MGWICLNFSMIDQTDDSRKKDFLSFLRSVEPSHESILKSSLSTSWQMGYYGFQLAEPLMLKGALSPSLTGCGNVPLTTNWVPGAGEGCYRLVKTQGGGAGSGRSGDSPTVTTPYIFVRDWEGGDGTVRDPAQPHAERYSVVRREHLVRAGSLVAVCVPGFLWRLDWAPWQ